LVDSTVGLDLDRLYLLSMQTTEDLLCDDDGCRRF
jgi:hypothetical protein